MATLKLRVSGMSCGHCQAKVAAALQTTAGVYTAIVDLRAGEAEIDFNDDSVTTQQLVDDRRINPCRSEEHTSELQSLRHLVCRLLLEKKKRRTTCRER